MKLLSSVALVGLLSISSFAPRAEAASFAVNFCPADATCPAGITAASLTFIERLDTGDVNDYFLDLALIGDASAPDFVDIVSFKIDGVDAPNGYQSMPSLVSTPAGTWTTYFDNVSGNSAACTSNTGQQQAVCSNGADPGASMVNATLTWRYAIDLAGTFQLGEGSAVNLRASFIDAQQVQKKVNKQWVWVTEYKNAGILSPGGGLLECVDGCPVPDPCTTGNCPPDATVPEPATMALLGIGLLGAGALRRRIGR